MTFGLSAAAIGGIAAGAGALGGALISADAAGNAADTQRQAGRDATQAQREILERQIQIQEPWRQAGGIGLNALLYGMGLSPTGTFQPGTSTGGTPLLTPGSDGIFTPSTGALAQSPGGETAAQIRARLAPQFTTGTQAQLIGPAARGGAFGQILGNAALQASGLPPTTVNTSGLDAAVAAEMARQQQAAAAGQQTATTNASTDRNYGALTRNFTNADFVKDPGYDFRLHAGEQGMTRAAAAAGGLGSGKYLKDAMAYNQGFASNELTNAYNRFNTNRDATYNKLAALSGVGQTSANTLTNAAGQFGQQIGSNIIGAGNAAAAGQVGAASAINGAIGQGIGLYTQQNMLNRMFPYGGVPYNPAASGPASFGDYPTSFFG